MKNNLKRFLPILSLILSTSCVALASVESTLMNLQNKVLGTYLPMAAIFGLLWAGFSFVTGKENAKQHLLYAIFGCIVGFGSQSIVAALRSMVN
ncbi:MAG: TrbC/VirB2 family protein [Bdellovibrionaceae bacterium]|nr:TrbC/VirB2 family protein [Pseudobdellovibrionaceae bacterium]